VEKAVKRVLLILAPPLVTLILLAVAIKYWALPSAEDWALKKLKSYSEQNLPVVIEAERIQFHLIKPSAAMEKITITSKSEIQKYTEKISIESMKVNLDIFQLLTGRVQISAVLVDSPTASLKLDPILESPSKPEPLPLNLVFDWADKIPLERVFLHNVHLKLFSLKHKSSADVQGGDLLLNNHLTSLSARMDIPRLDLVVFEQGPLQTRLDLSATLSRESLKITRAGARYGESEIILKGEFDQFQKVALHPRGRFEANADVKFQEILQQLRPILSEYKIPQIQGEATAKINLSMDGLDKLSGQMDVQTKDVSIASFAIGSASVQGVFKGKSLSFSEAEIVHPAGKARLINTDLQLEENLNFKTTLRVSELDLQKLFVSLNLPNIPVWVDIKGEMPCQGQIKMPFKVTCEGSVHAENILVTSDHKNRNAVIVDITRMSAKGSTEITDKAITYKAQLQAGANTGESTGTIEYAKGFNINYSTPRLDVINIKNLANLKFKGYTSIEGSTSGDSSAATFNMKLKAQDFSFEDYYFGQVNGNLSYKKSHLYIEDISGLLPKSTYQGSLDVNFHESRITGRVKAPTLDLSDLVKVFEQQYLFPLTVRGGGNAEMSFSGPFDFWKMSYQLDSHFKGGQFAGESFDDLVLNAQATEGNLQLQKAVVKKAGGVMTASGGISPQQEMNFKIEGRGFRLDESDFINKISSSIFGILNFTSQVRGKIKEPEVSLRGSITETVLDEQEIPSSFFDLKVRRNLMEGNANFFGHRIQADWLLPFGNSPLRLRLKTVDWNYASMFSILGGNSLQNEYDSSLTADIDLRSESGQWQKATGNIQIKNLFLKRGNLSFRNPDPIQIRMDDGRIRINHFSLEGPQNSIQLRGQDFTLNNLNVNFVANTELRLFHMFFPFFDDLGGSIRSSATISGSMFKPQILGNLTTDNSFLKIKGFPHPIERIQADVSFSQTKILINSIKAQMAGGVVSADGNILIRDYHDIPTSIRLTLDSVRLNVPDKVRTSGSAELMLTGKWFPFLLSGTYRVSRGVFEREFTDDGGAGPNTRQSVYLPKILRQSNFEPLILDIQILFERSFLVKNSLVDGAVQGNLQVKGPLSHPILLGKLQTDKNTKLTFKDKIFDVQSGTIQFTNMDEINPELYISAQSRVSDYDINLLVQGPAKNLKNIRLTSVPPLSEQDIVSLLALGVTSTRMDQSVGSRDQAAQTGYELGFAIFSQTVNKQFQDRLGVNVQFTSSFDSTRNISVPKVTVSRKLSNKVNASLSRALGEQDTNEAKLQYLINQNVSAIGSYQDTSNLQSQGINGGENRKENIFGLDLEFKKEFK
jgi:translocation and assembly module TamB